jgi:hypothetical protein
MSRLPDLVLDSKLETQIYSEEYCVHTYYESDPNSRKRAVPRQEYWQRQRIIGRGSYGSVSLEKCVKGYRDIEVRAVKRVAIPKAQRSKQINYHQELEAILKFSQPRVRIPS